MVLLKALWLRCRFDERVIGTANHFVKRCAGGDHWIDGIFLLDAEVDENGFLGFARGANGREHIAARSDALAADAESVRQRGKIRRYERRGHVTLIVEKFLPLADHAEKTVVDNGDLDVDFFLDDG